MRLAVAALVLGLLAVGCENEPCGDATCRLDETCCQSGCTATGEPMYFCAASCPAITDAGCGPRPDASRGDDATTSQPLVCELRADPDAPRPVRFELDPALGAMDAFAATVTEVTDERLTFESGGATGDLVWVGPRLPGYFDVGEAVDVSVSGAEIASTARANRVGFVEVALPGSVAGVLAGLGEPACRRGDTIFRYCAFGAGPRPDLVGSELHYVFLGGILTAPFGTYEGGAVTVTNVEALRDPPPAWECGGSAPDLNGDGLFTFAVQ